jgi:hypothetical protein
MGRPKPSNTDWSELLVAYAFVQFSSDAGTISSTAAGNCLVCALTNSGGGARLIDLGAGWIQAEAELVGAVNNYASNLYYYPNNPGGITSVTPSWSGGTPGEVGFLFAEYSGLAASPFLDCVRQLQASPGTGTDAVTSGTASLSAGGKALVGFSADPGPYTTINAGTAFASRGTVAGERLEDRAESGAGSFAALFTGAADPQEAHTWLLALAEPSSSTSNLLSGKFGGLLRGKL